MSSCARFVGNMQIIYAKLKARGRRGRPDRKGGSEMSEVYKKCDNCNNWALGCELDGDFRRSCIKDNYDCYSPKEGIILSS